MQGTKVIEVIKVVLQVGFVAQTLIRGDRISNHTMFTLEPDGMELKRAHSDVEKVTRKPF